MMQEAVVVRINELIGSLTYLNPLKATNVELSATTH